MKFRSIALPAIALIAFSTVLAQPRTEGDATTPTSAPESVNPELDREAQLIKRLTNAVLRGSFQMTNADGLEGRAPMTKPSVERYEISGISKLGGNQWVITARIQYADRDVLVPVPVRILWAAGTPIITLDKMKIPMIGEYSARVVIDDGFYGGTWRGATYGGVLSGQILKKDDVEKIEKMEAAGWEMQMPSHAPKGDATTEK
ncbi:MAG: hypothetical protein H6818_09005 [Phycisphaerales bacterium]|nr:hypothetical protein [Phycisphaerales bacterium]MCB9862708.1 hypothetical protein [Phycisphaerales bacterium]